jgi:uncharacterized protein (TIGR00251 family)
MVRVHESAAGVTFAVRVQPRASRNSIIGEIGDALKIGLIAPPVEGKANQACVDFLAGILKLPRSAIVITSGERGRNKVIRVTGISAAQLQQRLHQ